MCVCVSMFVPSLSQGTMGRTSWRALISFLSFPLCSSFLLSLPYSPPVCLCHILLFLSSPIPSSPLLSSHLRSPPFPLSLSLLLSSPLCSSIFPLCSSPLLSSPQPACRTICILVSYNYFDVVILWYYKSSMLTHARHARTRTHTVSAVYRVLHIACPIWLF